MKHVAVYRVDSVKNTKERIGTVIERRKRDRGNNRNGLLRLARKLFAASPEDALLIALDLPEIHVTAGAEGLGLPLP
jgi:hypothetical protein